MAKVCDRCKNKLDTDNPSVLNGKKFELCRKCADYIANHIKKYKEKPDMFGGIFK